MIVLKFLILSILPVGFLAAGIIDEPGASDVENVIAKIDHPVSEVPASSDGMQDDWKKQQSTINAERRLPPDRFEKIKRLHELESKLNKGEKPKSIAEKWLDEKLRLKSKGFAILWKFSKDKSQLMINGEARTWDRKDHIYDWIDKSVDADELVQQIDEFNKSIEDLPKRKAKLLEKLEIMNPLQYLGILEMRNPTLIELHDYILSIWKSILPEFVSIRFFSAFVFPLLFVFNAVDYIYLISKIAYYAATSDVWIVDATGVKIPQEERPA